VKLPVIFRAFELAVKAAELGGKAYGTIKRLLGGSAPIEPAQELPDFSLPLSHKDVAHQQAQIRNATTVRLPAVSAPRPRPTSLPRPPRLPRKP
jgi:hypothetical protein